MTSPFASNVINTSFMRPPLTSLPLSLLLLLLLRHLMGGSNSKLVQADLLSSLFCGFQPIRQRNNCQAIDSSLHKPITCSDNGAVVDSDNAGSILGFPPRNVPSPAPTTGPQINFFPPMTVAGQGDQEAGREENEAKQEGFDEEEDEKGSMSDYNGALLIGAPSFREYCKIDCESENSFDNNESTEGEKKEVKDDEPSIPIEELDSHLDSKKKSCKGGRGIRFKKVFPVGRASMVKNLLNVTACYNPQVSASRHKLEKPIER